MLKITSEMTVDEGDPILYVLLENGSGSTSKPITQYARPMLQLVLILMGCKTRYAHKITQRVLKLLESEASRLKLGTSGVKPEGCLPQTNRHRSKFNDNELGLSVDLLHADSVETAQYTSKRLVRFSSNGQPESSGQTAPSYREKVLITPSAGEGLQGRETSISQTAEDAPGNPVSGVEQLRTPSFHARLRKGKWPADVPGPDALGQQVNGFEGNRTELANGQAREGHRTSFEGLALDHDASRSPKDASMFDTAAAPSWTVLRSEGASVWMKRSDFEVLVCALLREFGYNSVTQRQDFQLACRLRERRTSVTVLLCGTSGCGKSTLAALLAGRLGITTVVSTDSIRHMMRSFVPEEQNPLLWASTYHAGECLDPALIARTSSGKGLQRTDSVDVGGEAEGPTVTQRRLTIKGYKAQSEMVIESIDRLVSSYEARGESLVIEGVHLSLNFVMGLMARHASIVPFLVYIANEGKHLERMAVRAKYMTLDPKRNKYVKYMRNIRTIQDYLCKRADKHLVPKVNNTNVDRSVAAIHAAVFSSIRRREAGEPLLDSATNTARVVFAEYEGHIAQYSTVSSKGMLRLIRRKGSSRSLLAALQEDNPLTSEQEAPASDTPPANAEPIPAVGPSSWEGGASALRGVAQGSGRIGSAGSSLGRSVERALMYGLEHGGQVGESEEDEDGEGGEAHSQDEEGGLSDENAEQGGEPEEGSVDGSTMASDEDASGWGPEEAMFSDTWAAGKGSGRMQGRLSTLAEQEGEENAVPLKNVVSQRQTPWILRRKSTPVDVPLDLERLGVHSPGRGMSEHRRPQSAWGRERSSARATSEGGSASSSPLSRVL